MVTIVLLVSRETFLQRIFTNLELLECQSVDTNLFVYVDGDYTLFEKARNFTVKSKFIEKLCVYRRKGLPNVGSIRSRRKRIADIHNEIKASINKCEYIFLIEDDTIVPLNTLQTLLQNYSDFPFAGFISGIELGRWGYAHIGAWLIDDAYNTKRITSVPNESGIKEVDAAGFFCCLIKRDNYMQHNFLPYEDILGPDVDFGIKLRQAGLKNYINYDLKCKHVTKRGDINFLNTDVIQVEFNKDGEKWNMHEIGT